MIEIKLYEKKDKDIWDDFIPNSKVDTFLFYRDFMDYHSDRFIDHSFLIFKKDKLEAILPGNIIDNIFYSHKGLTYGGIVSSLKMTTKDIEDSFLQINTFLKNKGVKEVIYKPTPSIYHLAPSEEDIYVLFKLNATKIACNLSSTIKLNNSPTYSELRRRGIKKALKNGVKIDETMNFEAFWRILEDNLMSNHSTKPVHSLNEIIKLKKLFNSRIKLYTASIENNIIGGCILFIMNRIVHVQYISANETGKLNGALDMLFDYLIIKYKDFNFFDFGQSTEKNGFYLNEGLIFQKEGFGGRGINYETYKYTL
jgi:hypothetical protein